MVAALVRTARAHNVPPQMPGIPVRHSDSCWDASLPYTRRAVDLDDGSSIRQCNTANVGVNLYL